MFKQMVIYLSLISVSASILTSVVVVTFPVTAMAHNPKEIPACTKIVTACESAGYEPGDHKKNGKGLWIDCVGAISKGKTVSGVSATADDAKSCIAAHKAHHEEHAEKKSETNEQHK